MRPTADGVRGRPCHPLGGHPEAEALTPTRGDLVLLTSWTSTRASPPSVTSVASSPCARGTTPTVTFPRSPRHTAPAARMFSTPPTPTPDRPRAPRRRRPAHQGSPRRRLRGASGARRAPVVRGPRLRRPVRGRPRSVPGRGPLGPRGSAPDDLWLAEVRPLPGDAASLAAVVLHGHLEPLSAALRTRHRVAPALLRGNAASALAAAAREITRRARPDAAARATPWPATSSPTLLAYAGPSPTPIPALKHRTGTLPFRRRSCCLYYRVPGGGVCGDCCFVRPPCSSPRAPTA